MTIGFNPWSDIEQSERMREPIKPLWQVKNFSNKKKVLKWLNDTLPIVEEYSRDRIQCLNYNIDWYMGLYDENGMYRPAIPGRRDVPQSRQSIPMIVNHLWDLTEQHVARLSRFKPAVAVMPSNDEWNDKVSAKLAELLLKNIFYINDMDYLMIEIERWNKVFGEAYLFVEWDKHLGDVKDRKTYERFGDVRYDLRTPKHIFLEPKRRFQDANWFIEIKEIMHIEEARKKYKKPKLEPDKSTKIYSYADAEHEKHPDEVAIYRVVYKPNEFCERGTVFCATKEELLEVEEEKYPWSHGEFPFVRITDIDVPGWQYGVSYFQQLIPMQQQYNKLSSLIRKNIALTAHPKWKFPKGTCKPEAFGNDITLMPYDGSIAPELEIGKSVSAETFAFRENMKEELQQISGIHGVSRGDPPPGIRAGIALQFLEEQEQQRASTAIIKHNDLIRRVARKTLGVVGDHYDTNDARMLRVVGSNNQYELRSLKNAKLSGPYDVRVQNSTALSESKAGRISQIIELKQNFPEMLTDDQVVDLLDLGQAQKFYDIATAAIKCAESENEDMLDGRYVEAPSEEEELITHWRTHLILMQSRSYKEDVPDKVKAEFENHVMFTEYLMFERSKNNVKFKAILQEQEYYPVLFVTDPQVNLQGPAGPGPGGPGGPGQGPGGGPQMGPSPAMPQPGIQEPPVPTGEPVGQGAPMPMGAQVPVAPPVLR